jgi:hypothetical protein
MITDWHTKAHVFFADMTRSAFPDPPSEPCRNMSCHAQDRVLEACECNIRKLFTDLDVKLERRMWHPDRFSACLEGSREEYQKKAAEIFVVIQEEFERLQEPQRQ